VIEACLALFSLEQVRSFFSLLSKHLQFTQFIFVFLFSGKDDVFGENICVHETIGKSSCNVRALTYCDLHKIHRDDLLDILEMYPEFAENFANNLQVTFELRDVSICFHFY
jgi:CRP-like cAMP-binding protein